MNHVLFPISFRQDQRPMDQGITRELHSGYLFLLCRPPNVRQKLEKNIRIDWHQKRIPNPLPCSKVFPEIQKSLQHWIKFWSYWANSKRKLNSKFKMLNRKRIKIHRLFLLCGKNVHFLFTQSLIFLKPRTFWLLGNSHWPSIQEQSGSWRESKFQEKFIFWMFRRRPGHREAFVPVKKDKDLI